MKHERQFTARYGGTCAACGGRYIAGDTVLYVERLGAGPQVTHRPSDCLSAYTVKVVYDSTSKQVRVGAHTADSAIEAAAAQCDPVVKAEVRLREARYAKLAAADSAALRHARTAIERAEARLYVARQTPVQERPSCYVCYQGNVLVASKLAAAVRVTA